ncbi:MAG: M20/M25/M40 family metallo-hydrolase [Myxococcota bacterium]
MMNDLTRSVLGSFTLSLGVVVGCHPAGHGESPASEVQGVERAVASIQAEDLREHIQVLASDDFEGRFPGSAGETKTVAYLTAHLAQAGFQPGLEGSYLQPVPLRSVTLRDTSRASIRGAGEPISLAVPDDLIVGSATVDPRVELKEAAVVFVGHGITAPEYGWDDYAGVDVRGKVVVVVRGDPGPSRDDPEFFDGRALTLYGTTGHKAEQAAEHGAAAMLILHDSKNSPVAWEVFGQGARRPKQQLAESSGPAKVPIVGLVQRLTLEQGLDDTGRATLQRLQSSVTRDDFVATELPLRLSVVLEREVNPVVSHNVVAVLPGRTRPDEHVVYTAHWDHVGRGTGEGDTIYNGAVDNATGTAALLELAQAYAALPQAPERSVVLVATTAEEQGLLGATWYAEHPVLPLADAVGVINMDALFPFGATKGMTVVALGSSELEDYMAAAAQTVGRKLYPDPAPEMGAFFRSDHYPFALRGVPAIFAVGGISHDPNDVETVTVEDFVQFVQGRYHQVTDEYDDSWDMAGIVQDVTIYFRTGHALANDQRRPQWVEGSPFRARHEALRAQATGS